MKNNFIVAGILLATLTTSTVAAQNKNSGEAKEKPTIEYSTLPKVDLKDFKKNKKGEYVIFDGTSLNGWRGYNKSYVPNKWSIEDGALKFSKNPKADKPEGGDIIFTHDFKNFELSFKWKISEAGNSGVFVLAKEVKGQPIYVSSPEYQILDNVKHPDAKMGVNGNRMSASLYDMIPATPQNSKPAGEWNTSKIVVNGDKITHYQNDVKVVEYTVRTKDWTKLLQSSKFSEDKWPIAFELLNNVGGDTKSGVIGFQDHGDDVWFKDITVKVLK
ncbi:3-keto-disaccharide hydrolase [Sphingobacterium rhinopitheci]|uniref:3-keto-disaccharide hydrolase n=1 Tax=Sphingobacterium rhinopitheci TaxID=2781960 RepID=UPI001F529EE6|nr:DUF1080 domain-containing protein [Sphingobacterium rhinopitheci]MCI0922214.1 DUF1080 domain-containing protein [Sphingobacterium rhinopitheci]